MHVLHSIDPGGGIFTPYPFLLNFGSARLWDGAYDSWRNIEPVRNTYRWTELDALVAQYRKMGVELTYTFGRTPQWASREPISCPTYNAGECYPPADIAMWDEFVAAMGQRYCGQIRNWEIWNEADYPAFYQGSIEEMVTMAEHAYRILRDNSTCACDGETCAPGLATGQNSNVVFTPAISSESDNALAWLDAYLAAGGGDYADAIAVHVYGCTQYSYVVSPENLLKGIKNLNSILRAHGQAGKPLWSSEGAWLNASILPNSDSGAAWASRFMLMHIVAGLERFYWYEYDPWSGGGLTDQTAANSQELNQTGIAWRETAKWLTGAQVALCQSYPDSSWACQITRQNGYGAWMIWNSNSSKIVQVSSSAGLTQYRDIAGNKFPLGGTVQIGPKPILLEAKDGF